MVARAEQTIDGLVALTGLDPAQLVELHTDITWFVLDDAARTLGLEVDPDADFSRVMNDPGSGLAR